MTNKKETILDVLKDIRNLLREKAVDAINVPSIDKSKYLKVTFPNKTAKEIIDECENKLGKDKFLYNTEWYKNEKFFTEEKCRPGIRYVSKELIGLDKDWNECKELVENQDGEMLNFAETIFFIQEYFEQTDEYPWNLKWSWTSSRSSFGDLVRAGGCDSGGVDVVRDFPGRSGSDLGVCFSRSEILKID